MKLQTFVTITLLVGLACSAPTSNKDIVSGDKDVLSDLTVIYTAQHDIVNILLPLYILSIKDNSDNNKISPQLHPTLFFVEADTNENGERVDQGLYIYKNGITTKLLDHGRDTTATNDDSKTAFFAAKDGIYSYNAKKNTAEKYGTVTDDLIGIAKVNGSDVFYVLTKDQTLYKVTEKGTKKEKVENVVNAKQIVLDHHNNLYYYTTDKQVYVLVNGTVKKFEDLPEKPNSIVILKPPFVMENGVPVVIDKKIFFSFENGTSQFGEFVLTVNNLTAYSLEATLVHYYGYNKKIYEFNIVSLILDDIFNKLKSSHL